MNSFNSVDLLNPVEFFKDNYVHQLRQTIAAYSASMIVVGEALQNSIDAVCSEDVTKGNIFVSVDFDSESVTVRDNGPGFPKNISLLYLGGSLKTGKRLKGNIGVGIKVTLFSSKHFCLRSRSAGDDSWTVEINDACKFETLSSLVVPNPPSKDLSPLEHPGTEVSYTFEKSGQTKSYLDLFIEDIINYCLPRGNESAFLRSVKELTTGFPSPIGALLSSFFRRFSYAGDVLAASGEQKSYPIKGIEIYFKVKCSNPIERFGEEIGHLFNEKTEQSFAVEPSYLLVQDTLKWVSKGKKAPLIFNDKLGRGGDSVQRTDGFNCLLFNTQEDFESLLLNIRGNLPQNIEYFRINLFPYINKIHLTIGRIPDFERFLPGGSQRVISCNGVITRHDIDLTRGRNQEYVRCFDLVIDVNSELNYGKTQLTNLYLVKYVRDFINEAYVRVIQNATSIWVGKLPNGSSDEDTEIFIGRENLGLEEYMSQKVPRDENDVIGLFFELGAKKILKDYRVYGLTQKAVYDGRAAVKRECDDDKVFEPKDDSKLRTIEFKVLATDVIRDFDRRQKDPREIDLVIAWDSGQYSSKDYAIYDIEESEAFKASPKKVFPLATKYIYNAREGVEIQILLLKDVIATLKSKPVNP
jgi:hypothetical protein